MPDDAPVGVKLLAGYYVLEGVLALPGAVTNLATAHDTEEIMMGSVALSVSIALVALAYGLLKLRHAAWFAAFGVQFLAVGIAWFVFYPRVPLAVGRILLVLTVLVGLVVGAYLWRVRERFGVGL